MELSLNGSQFKIKVWLKGRQFKMELWLKGRQFKPPKKKHKINPTAANQKSSKNIHKMLGNPEILLE
jgi:hypothetical protein